MRPDPHAARQPNVPLHRQTNFYFAMRLLPAPRRCALEALYRFCREADDIVDNPGRTPVKNRRLKDLRLALRQGFKTGRSDHPLLGPYLAAALPLGVTRAPLETILDGCERDLKPVRFKTFRELRDYSLKVAGGPGLASMEIFGFHDEPHRAYARNLGLFLQMTNVTRDVKEDLSMGRLYLPEEDWKRFGLKPGELPSTGPAWDSFVRFQLDRALDFWQAAQRDLDLRERGCLTTAEAIAAIYRRIHRKLHERPSLALSGRVRLSVTCKITTVLGTWLRCLACKGWSSS